MEDTFESLEDDDLEEEADDAVEAILFEVTKGQLGKAGAISNKPLDVKGVEVEDEEEDEEEMRERLAALNS
jgi:charged multivesicular body protein 3